MGWKVPGNFFPVIAGFGKNFWVFGAGVLNFFILRVSSCKKFQAGESDNLTIDMEVARASGERSRDMYFEQFYLTCLAHASYMIGSEGEAAVVDPQRDVDIYLESGRAAES
jgi:hypothetical protein